MCAELRLSVQYDFHCPFIFFVVSCCIEVCLHLAGLFCVFITFTVLMFYSNHDSVTVGQQAQYQDLESKAAKWNSAMIHFTVYTLLSLL